MDEIRETALPYKGKLTYEDYAKLPEGAPYQLIGGELVLTPAPILYHQDVSANMGGEMRAFVIGHRYGKIYFPPTDVYLDNHETYQPDIVFVSSDRKGILQKKRIEGAPDLVVEVLSPTTARFDLGEKFANYEKYGVLEYWIIDPVSKTIEIFVRTEGKLVSNQKVDNHCRVESKVLAGFAMDTKDIFDPGD